MIQRLTCFCITFDTKVAHGRSDICLMTLIKLPAKILTKLHFILSWHCTSAIYCHQYAMVRLLYCSVLAMVESTFHKTNWIHDQGNPTKNSDYSYDVLRNFLLIIKIEISVILEKKIELSKNKNVINCWKQHIKKVITKLSSILKFLIEEQAKWEPAAVDRNAILIIKHQH